MWSSNTGETAYNHSELEPALYNYTAGKDARIGITVIIDGADTVSVNGRREFPMLSVYKFPQALAVADYCRDNDISLTDSISINASEIKRDTWSPLRERYGIRDLRLPLSELLAYSLQQSDNNACDILFRLIGGPAAADSVMKSLGFRDIVMAYTEDDMHGDIYLCYQNRSTPMEMARLFDRFYRMDMQKESPVHDAIGEMMIQCETGISRLPAPLTGSGCTIGHKTGTGDRNHEGRIIGVNDAGYVFLPGGRGYAIAVFIADSAYDMVCTEKMIADISGIVFRFLRPKETEPSLMNH